MIESHFAKETDEVQQPNIEVMTKRKCICLAIISGLSLVFALISLLSYNGPMYDYIKQHETFACSKSAHTVKSDHDHSF